MTMNGQNARMAEMLFPNRKYTPPADDTSRYEARYPKRSLPAGAAVTRLGPSPTGFIHLGNLYTAFMNEKLAKETGGVCYLRIEDTDRKREVEGAAGALIESLRYFGISFDEGVGLDEGTGEIIETGDYGPYFQSQRADIYQAYAGRLVAEGLAYPCFMGEEELAEIRRVQEAEKRNPGIYGTWAKYRGVGPEKCGELIGSGLSYVIRLNADKTNAALGISGGWDIKDGIRGSITMPANEMDVVLLKSDGIPTYHFAHVIDDRLMGTTHVIRGEEWLSSLPIHMTLFGALGFEPPAYCHTTVLMKMDGGAKRKLSKRKDPELSLDYYRNEGYHPKAILEYLLTIINSNFEEWRESHPDSPIEDFQMTVEKMGVSGILFDLDKLRDVSKNVLLGISSEELAEFMLDWAERCKPEALPALTRNPGELSKILDIGRNADKPRKDLAYAKQIFGFIGYFYDEFFVIEDGLPENIPAGDAPVLLEGYLEGLDLNDSRDIWFEKIRALAEAKGYAAKPKDYKKEPEKYKGHVGDVSSVVRIALVGRANSPDLYEIQRIMGKERVEARILSYIKNC